jgi:hypothetical protein
MPNALKIPALAAILFLFNCSAQQYNASTPEDLKLLPPAEMSAAVMLKQKISLQSGEQQQQFLLVARFEPQRLKLVVLSPTAQRLLTLDYDGIELIQENFSSIDVPAEDILSIIQFAMWPAQSIKKHYPQQAGWLVDISPEKRILSTPTGILLKINYEGEKLIIENYIHDYRVIVHSLEKSEL